MIEQGLEWLVYMERRPRVGCLLTLLATETLPPGLMNQVMHHFLLQNTCVGKASGNVYILLSIFVWYP